MFSVIIALILIEHLIDKTVVIGYYVHMNKTTAHDNNIKENITQFFKKGTLFFAALFMVLALLPDSVYALDAGSVSPDFHVRTLDNKEISYYKDLKGKKPVYLVFWTTW